MQAFKPNHIANSIQYSCAYYVIISCIGSCISTYHIGNTPNTRNNNSPSIEPLSSNSYSYARPMIFFIITNPTITRSESR